MIHRYVLRLAILFGCTLLPKLGMSRLGTVRHS
ncbi:hypothetical protein SAMN05720354_107100 [Nitrosospira sp. Nsp1]|nr:hypothetical protein SAMN05720354_107100 [Nitrosospira sp. Nsp1]